MMNTLLRNYCALFFCVCSVASAADDKKPAFQLLDQMRKANSTVTSFTAEMQLERFSPDYALQNQMVWFKRPQYIKLRQTGPFKTKAELAIKPDGSIRGHLGGFLSFAVVNLDKDDKNLLGVTHDSAFDTDFGRILDSAYRLAERMSRFQITERVVAGKRQTVFDSYYDNEIEQYRLVIDASSMMLHSLERYKNRQLLHRIQWKTLQLNVSVDDREFDL